MLVDGKWKIKFKRLKLHCLIPEAFAPSFNNFSRGMLAKAEKILNIA
jgi:hypothetical protein